MVKKNRKRKSNRSTWLVLTLVFGYFLFQFVTAEIQLIQLESQKKALEKDLVVERNASEQLREELDRLDSDDYIESLARKYFGLVYPQEKIIIEAEE
ncbi:MAG TPA: hypothetical protein DHN33_11220 [Eubacteriaceae bacterium]|jgi:cell division protein FtsB|nr:hypothetical protein [Eubacteriaceae bacterium]